MARWMTCFYAMPMWGFLAISVAATLLRQSIGTSSQDADSQQSLTVMIVFCVAQLCATLWMQRKKSAVGARTRAALFGDTKFAAMFAGTEDGRCFDGSAERSLL